MRLIGRLAALLLLLQLGSQAKGDAFALELVRRDADGRLQEPTHFEPSDRFKALVTCPTEWRGVVGVIVYQDGESYLPLGTQALESCGNRRALDGAFRIDGSARARVCAGFAANISEWRERNESDDLCTQLEPSTSD